MRFHVKNNKNQKIFVGFQVKNYRFVFYTHGKIKSVEDWEHVIKNTFGNKIYDEDPKGENLIDWDQFMAFVDHCQYWSNAKWANGYRLFGEYNFSHNVKD